MTKETMNVEEVVLAPNTEVIEAAEQVAIASSKKEKYSFIIEYDINEKEFLISVMEKAECVIEEIVDPESKIIVSMNKDQLKVIKVLDCVNRVSANDDYENVVAVMETTPETVAMTAEVTELQTASLETEASYSLAENTAVAAAATTAGSTMDTAIELTIDQWKAGSIECECGEAWFKFTADATAAHYNGGNGEYTITTNGGEDTVGYLYNSSRSMIDYDDDGGIGMQFSITASLKYGSTYYVCVKEYNCRACDFNIKVTYTPIENTGEDMARAFPLSLGTTINGNLCCPEGATWYRFVANDSSVHTSGFYAKYNVTINSAFDVTINMYDSNNQRVPFYDSEKNGNELVKSAKLFYDIPYYLVVESASQDCGDYTIRVDGITQWVSVTGVNIDQTSVVLPEGHTERLMVTVSPLDATNKNIIWSTSDDTYATVSVATGVVMAQKAGNATITAKSSDREYKSDSLNVTVTPAGSYHDCGGNTMATATTLTFDTWMNGTIKCSKGEDWYKFIATSTGEYTIIDQSDFDSIGYLYNADGEEIASNDDGGTNNNFRITAELGAGTYYVRIKSFWPGSGDYSIIVTYTPIDSDQNLQPISKDDYLSQSEMENNAKIIYKYLQNKGWSFGAICGAIANMEVESTINPGLWEKGINDINKRGYGLVQWTPAVSKWLSYADENGYEYDDLFKQLDYLIYTMGYGMGEWLVGGVPATYKLPAYEYVKSELSAYNLAIVFMLCYERPQDQSEDAQARRGNVASDWAEYFVNLGW